MITVETERDTKGRFVKGMAPHNRTEGVYNECPKCRKVVRRVPSQAHIVHCSISCAKTGEPSPRRGVTLSAQTREKCRQAKLGIRGPDHWNYRGYPGSERHRLMQQDEYKTWRQQVFERDDYTCQRCNVRGGYLHAHHVERWTDAPHLRYVVSNGKTLCPNCHRAEHREAGQ